MPDNNKKNGPMGQNDAHFDKKLLCFIFLVVLGCLMGVYRSPITDQFEIAQNMLVTVLTGALTTLLGGIITLTSGRLSQRSADPQQPSTEPSPKPIEPI